jgi:hypothetical protein
MRSCLSNLDPLQNTPTLAKLHPKMITASTSRASVSRVRAAKKTCPRSSAPQFQLRQNFCHTAICIQKVPVCASSLADTTTSRFTIAPSDKTNDHRPVIVDHNFQFFFLVAPSPYLAGLGTTPGKFRARTLSGKPLRKRSDLNFKWPVAHLGQHLVRRPRVCATLSKPILYMGNFPITRRPWNFRRFRRRTAPRRSTFMAAVEKNRADGGRAAIKTHR